MGASAIVGTSSSVGRALAIAANGAATVACVRATESTDVAETGTCDEEATAENAAATALGKSSDAAGTEAAESGGAIASAEIGRVAATWPALRPAVAASGCPPASRFSLLQSVAGRIVLFLQQIVAFPVHLIIVSLAVVAAHQAVL